MAFLNGSDPLGSSAWLRWDSEHYIRIAEAGYSCVEVDQYGSKVLQGNAGWFPGFPLIIRTLHYLTGINVRILAVLIPVFFTLLLFCEFLKLLPISKRRKSALALLILIPGGIYWQSGFPMSLCLLSLLICMKHLSAGTLALAFIAGCMAAVSHPGAIMLAPACIIWSLWPFRISKIYRSLVVCGGLVLSTLMVHYFIDQQTGFKHSYFRVQRGFGSNTLQNPFFVAYDKIRQFNFARFKNVFINQSFILKDPQGKILGAEYSADGKDVLKVSNSPYHFRHLFFIFKDSVEGAIYANELNLFLHVPDAQGLAELTHDLSAADYLITQEDLEQTITLKTAENSYLQIDQNGLLRANAADPKEATKFKKEYIFPGMSRIRHEFLAIHLIVSSFLALLASFALFRGNQLQRLFGLYLISCWLASLCAGATINHIRSDTFLAPLLIGLLQMPGWTLYPALLLLFIIALGAAASFFQGLIP